eukprot:CAMPEP_0172593736 /NCGR_PEP_ID=MMETSP1068-20121228/12979_1 /TAXON_ID=35684 /ORGANISM="Pseudopedinella elastica, Strain CCMP716" /LENGTH=182 /DNA_ID=CAMNT_0013391395 /DNA_START=289 /DNA_END=838 /DNA_ORIENTATION=-
MAVSLSPEGRLRTLSKEEYNGSLTAPIPSPHWQGPYQPASWFGVSDVRGRGRKRPPRKTKGLQHVRNDDILPDVRVISRYIPPCYFDASTVAVCQDLHVDTPKGHDVARLDILEINQDSVILIRGLERKNELIPHERIVGYRALGPTLQPLERFVLIKLLEVKLFHETRLLRRLGLAAHPQV